MSKVIVNLFLLSIVFADSHLWYLLSLCACLFIALKGLLVALADVAQ